MSARRNLLLFLPYQIASLEGFAHGLYVVWLLRDKRLSPEVAAAVLGAGDFALMLLEVPTGALADRFGRRGSLIVGSLAQVAGIALFWLGRGMPAMLAASLLVALGDAFRSGADEALLYETCQHLGQPERFTRLLAWSHALSTVALAGLVALGGHLAQVASLDAAWACETALCTVGLGLALAMVAVPRSAEADEDEEPGTLRLPPRQLTRVIWPATLVGCLLGVSELLFQARWPSASSLEGLTGAVAGMALIEALGSSLAATWGRSASLPLFGVAGLALAALGAGVPLAGLWGLALLDGWSKPLRSEQLQRVAREGERAQAASWAGMADTALGSLILPLAASLFTRAGPTAALLGVAALLAALWRAALWLSPARPPADEPG